MANADERDEELETLAAIFPELILDSTDRFSASLELAVTPTTPLLVRFIPLISRKDATYADVATNGNAYVERDVVISHLPPLTLKVTLPANYPADAPPQVRLSTNHDWLPKAKLSELEHEVATLWEEYGRAQTLFSYVDYLTQAAERGFDLDQSTDGCLVLPVTLQKELISFNAETKQTVFNAGTYDCGICLEPKKGAKCHQLSKCGHIFCKQCYQDFYNNAITEGDVASVKCLSPDCGKNDPKRRGKKQPTLHPRELLAIGIEESMVRRYVEMKRKKKMEADKTTVYCPRTWCQGPAKSPKYPPIPADLSTYAADAPSDDDDSTTAASGDRLAICEKCSLAFCKVCYMGWHGQFARCYPRDPSELSAEEKASYDYIRANTSPCPTCSSPTQKTMGCNHMNCFNCGSHFCYLCTSWLDGSNPYQHFNKPGTECYQRLWELEEGDEGQGPEDGRGFQGARRWEQMAIDAAREADEAEAAAAREPEPANAEAVVVGMAQVQIEDHEMMAQPQQAIRGGRRQRNPFPAHPPGRGAANIVRNHERNRRRPALNDQDDWDHDDRDE